MSSRDLIRIPFFDGTRYTVNLRAQLRSALEGVESHGHFTNGPEVRDFESQLASYLGVKHVVGLNSGSSALECAYRCMDVGPETRFLTVGLTWLSTVTAAIRLGARPTLVDVAADGTMVTDASLQQLVGDGPSVVVPVHFGGVPADVSEIRKRLPRAELIEDAAQSLGSSAQDCSPKTATDNTKGPLGRIGITSFYPTKNLGAHGEGGALYTNDDGVADRARRLRNHGLDSEGHCIELGANWRMDSYTAAILGAKLRYLEEWNQRRRDIAGRYDRALADVDGVSRVAHGKPASAVVPNVYSIFHDRRDEIQQRLLTAGVQTQVYYRRALHLQPALAELGYGPGSLPRTEAWCATQLALPCYPGLTDQEVGDVVDEVQSACADV